MAILGMDGFDQYSTAANDIDVSKFWTERSTPIYSTSNTPNGRGQAIQIEGTNDYLVASGLPNTTTVLCGFHYNPAPYGGTFPVNCDILSIADAGTVQFSLWLDPANASLNAYTGAGITLIAKSSDTNPAFLLQEGVYQHIELKATIGNSTNLEVRVDGVVWIIETTADTQTTANSYCNEVTLHGADDDAHFDNFYIADTDSSNNAQVYDFIGPSEIITLMPISDATPNEWTATGTPGGASHFNYVDEATADEGDYLTTNSNSAGTNQEKFGYEDLPTGTWTIYGVQPMIRTKTTSSGSANVKLTVSTTGGDNNSTVTIPSGSVYENDIYEARAAATYTTADINSMTMEMEYL